MSGLQDNLQKMKLLFWKRDFNQEAFDKRLKSMKYQFYLKSERTKVENIMAAEDFAISNA